MKLVNLITATNFIEKSGYDIQPIKKGNKFKVVVWRGDECLGEGKHEYKDWYEAVRKTTIDFYNKLHK